MLQSHDGAFGILLVVKCENGWKSHHAAEMSLQGGTSQERSDEWEDAKHTSSIEGARRGVNWPREGLVKFNELSKMVKKQRDEDEAEGSMVEAKLLGWCHQEAKMPKLATGSVNQVSGGMCGEVEEEVEVEAWGECGIFEV
jgi:hypothetical protein